MLTRPMTTHPTGFAYAIAALERLVYAPIEVVIVGDASTPATRALRTEVAHRLVPASVTLTAPDADPAIPLLADRAARDVPTAYVCEHYACREPVTDTDALGAQIDATLAARSS
jgi:uncharacterized protein YyaL (SSP411 family)